MTDPLAPVFEALGDQTRRSVLALLSEAGSASATQLAGAFPISRQAVAKHLQVLLDAGLVAAERRGRETLFAFVPGSLREVAAWLDAIDGGVPASDPHGAAALVRYLEEQRERRGIQRGLGVAATVRGPRPRA